MPILAWIIAATLVGGILSVIAAAAFALRARPAQVPMLISYAIGTLLGAAFLEILPHAFELSPSTERVTGTVLFGILGFFVLEKLMLWRHHHDEERHDDDRNDEDRHDEDRHDDHGHGHAGGSHVLRHGQSDHGRIAMMVIIGDTFHNGVDGVIIAGAFLVSVELGVITALAIITHEVPQEVGDFLVLLHSGYTRRQAFAFNVLASSAMVVGGIFAYIGLRAVHQWIPVLLGIAAASMIYVSVADLIPGLHQRRELRSTVHQVLLIAAGIATIWAVGSLARLLADV